MKQKILICLFLLLYMSCKKRTKNSIVNLTQDSIIHSKTKLGASAKIVFYPSKQKDSFKYREYYIEDELKDYCYISDNGFILGNKFSFDGEIKSVREYLNIDSKNFLNQFWTIKDKDTFSRSNFYQIKIFDSIKKNKHFGLQIVLKKSYRENFTNLFFLIPKKHYSVLKADFSNYKEIEFDTIHSLMNDKIPNNEVYKEDYWNKRAVSFKTGFADSGKNHIRGILVERKDSIFNDNKGNKSKFIDRYLFVNKEVYVYDD